MTKSELGIVVVVLAIVALMLWAVSEDEKAWAQFAKDHACKVVERTEVTTTTGYAIGSTPSGKTASGLVFTTEPGRTAYDCNDGVRYWR